MQYKFNYILQIICRYFLIASSVIEMVEILSVHLQNIIKGVFSCFVISFSLILLWPTFLDAFLTF